jgi:peptide/nickel transport system ATP-binding protein
LRLRGGAPAARMEVMPRAAVGETNDAEPLLQVRDLTVEVAAPASAGAPGGISTWVPVVSGASFQIRAASITVLFGESGCGKTTLALALPGLLPGRRYRTHGSVKLMGREIAGLSRVELEPLRGAEIGFVFQDPLLSLNPFLRVRQIVGEAMRAHPAKALGSVADTLELAGLEPSRRITDSYPHQLSGGERQRVAIAVALSCRPALIVADEPFTALDAPRVVELASLFEDLKRRLGVAVLLIDHSAAVAARIADEALVMYAGSIVERGAAGRLLREPLHPYTAALLACSPEPGAPRKTWPSPIPGNPPGLGVRRGCAFEPRCGRRMERCSVSAPPEYEPEARRSAMCYLYDR